MGALRRSSRPAAWLGYSFLLVYQVEASSDAAASPSASPCLQIQLLFAHHGRWPSFLFPSSPLALPRSRGTASGDLAAADNSSGKQGAASTPAQVCAFAS